MSLSKIGDDINWQRVIDAKAKLRTSTPSETMASLQLSQATIQQRKTEIEVALSALASKKTNSAWQAALGGGGNAIGERDRLLKEYRSLEEKERFNGAAIEEGLLEVDALKGKADMQICNDVKQDYQKAVIPDARAGARQMLKAMETDRRIVDELLR